MKRIGNNEFFKTERGAKMAGSLRGYTDGAKIWGTHDGYALLNLGEGADDRSYKLIGLGRVIAEMRNRKWVSR